MKAYGLPRNRNLISPDLVDISEYGLKSSISRIVEKGGDIKNSFRRSISKRTARRVWKKKERLNAKSQINGYIK